MSQTTLADAVGVSFQQLQKYENGPNRGASRLQHISHVLQVPTEFLFDGAPHTGANHTMSEDRAKLAAFDAMIFLKSNRGRGG